MINFSSWIDEAKKKGTKESLPPTASSSPTRGANQDYSGVGVKHDVADYTISDEKILKKVKEEACPTCIDNKCQCGTTVIGEMISGQPMSGPVQPKVSQGGGSPRSRSALQKVSDARVRAKERADQMQDQFRKSTAEKEIVQRKQAESKRKSIGTQK